MSAFTEAGGFADIVHFMGEEERLALDLASLGWSLCYVDDLTDHHTNSAAVQCRPFRATGPEVSS